MPKRKFKQEIDEPSSKRRKLSVTGNGNDSTNSKIKQFIKEYKLEKLASKIIDEGITIPFLLSQDNASIKSIASALTNNVIQQKKFIFAVDQIKCHKIKIKNLDFQQPAITLSKNEKGDGVSIHDHKSGKKLTVQCDPRLTLSQIHRLIKGKLIRLGYEQFRFIPFRLLRKYDDEYQTKIYPSVSIRNMDPKSVYSLEQAIQINIISSKHERSERMVYGTDDLTTIAAEYASLIPQDVRIRHNGRVIRDIWGKINNIGLNYGDDINISNVEVKGEEFDISFETLTGKTFGLKVKASYTVWDVKFLIQESEKLSPSDHRLIFEGKAMDDRRTLREYKVKKESKINLVLRLRGS